MNASFRSPTALKRWAALVLATLAAACATIERAALPEPQALGPEWSQFADAPGPPVDHGPWDAFLAAYAEKDDAGVVRIDYGCVSQQDRAALDAYLAALEAVDLAEQSRNQQLAYWINLYNAETVALVLDAYPVESIRGITDGPLSFGPWDRAVATVRGRQLSLNDVEHRIIRPIFQEPRIHYALNCAAVACPNLRETAWRADGLDAALEDAERSYVDDPRGVRTLQNGEVRLSKIYVWFREDFGADEDAVIARLADKASGAKRALLDAAPRVAGYDYDWALNDR